MSRPDSDGIVRQEWRGAIIPHAPVAEVRASATVTSSRAPAERKPPVPDIEQRVAEWDKHIENIVERETTDDDGGPGADAVVAEGLALLQRATDVALAKLERELIDRFSAENEGLRADVARLEGERADDAERHRRKVEGLAERLKQHESETTAKVDQIHDALTLMEAEAAEARSVDRLRTSSWMQRHRALVQQRLVARDLTKGHLQ